MDDATQPESLPTGQTGGTESARFFGPSSPHTPPPWATPGRALNPGERLDDFKLIRLIGKGGMGAVWEAEQISLGRRVALKVIRPSQVDARSVMLFQREARAGGKLQHSGLVSVHCTGEADGVHFIAQELVGDGHTLANGLAALRESHDTPDGYYREAATLITEIADAMQTAHDEGVIHRDLKPHNILIDENGSPKVTDFGLARIHDELALSGSLGVLGTLLYMSPEQAAAKSIGIDHRSDVFSLGVVLYEMLTLRHPFEGDTQQQVLEGILTADPPPARKVRSRVPYDLSVICEKAVEKNRSHRYQSMREFADDLRRFLANETIQARAPSALRRTQKWATRHPTASVAIALGVVALAVISTLLVSNVEARSDAEESAKLATKNVVLARERAEEAQRERLRADLERDRVLRLADVKALADLTAEARDDLWPIHPDLVAPLERWLDEADALAARLPDHLTLLQHMESGAFAAETRLNPAQQAWWTQTLQDLVAGLTAFVDPAAGVLFDVRARLATSSSLASRSVDAHAEVWEEAIDDIALNERYHGLELEPQMGLVPLGLDPDSGLWEFWHVETGDRPERDVNTGRILMGDDTGVVFVLLPACDVWIGAQKNDPNRPCYDPLASLNETPQQVSLNAFFLSKFEWTQGQWMRLAEENPSEYSASDTLMGADHRRHPVERVSWRRAREVLRRLGFALPTEAQWQYAATGGGAGPWPFGSNRALARLAGNAFDQSFFRRFPARIVTPEEWSDGHAIHAPVGTFDPNGFGFHDVFGNVWEWCEDRYVSFLEDVEFAPGDGRALTNYGRQEQLVKGGSFNDTLLACRLGCRNSYAPDYRDDDIGVRPARPLDGPAR